MEAPAVTGTAPSAPCPAGTTETANCAFEPQAMGTAFLTFQTALQQTGDNCNVSPPLAACFDDYVSVGTATSGTLTSDAQIVYGITAGTNAISYTLPSSPVTMPGTGTYYADCPMGYRALACSAVSTSNTYSPCQSQPDVADGAAPSACQYSSCAITPAQYNFFTTCVRF
jgi:hypothetical protein